MEGKGGSELGNWRVRQGRGELVYWARGLEHKADDRREW